MAGTKLGGVLAAETNYERYGQDFYKKIGKLGGQKSRNGGFAANPELAREAGRKGGLVKASQRRAKGESKVEPVRVRVIV